MLVKNSQEEAIEVKSVLDVGHQQETGKRASERLSGCFCQPKQADHFANSPHCAFSCLYLSGRSKHSPAGKHVESGSEVVLTLCLCEAPFMFPPFQGTSEGDWREANDADANSSFMNLRGHVSVLQDKSRT